jgi:UDP-glucose 4-epimerase
MDFGIFQAIDNSFKDNSPLKFFGEPTDSRDYIGEKDLSLALMHIVKSQIVNEIINIGSETSIQLSQIASEIEKITDGEIKTSWHSRRESDVPRTVLDCKKMQKYYPKSVLDPENLVKSGLVSIWQRARSNSGSASDI